METVQGSKVLGATDDWVLPRYQDLPKVDWLGARHAWGVFGDDDDLGRINLLTPDVVRAAVLEARLGRTFNLCLPLNLPDPSWSHDRRTYTHHLFSSRHHEQDDYLDSFYLQHSSQWDGLRHISAGELGFWNGVSPADAGAEGHRLGINNWAEHGIVGRGVLADVGYFLAQQGHPLDCRSGTAISAETLQATLDWQGTTLRVGDILMLRTGYLGAYLRSEVAQRRDFAARRDCPGLSAADSVAEFLWDSGIVAVVSDNPAVEVVPGNREDGFLHRRLIPLLGFALGELFDLDSLAADCAAEGRFTCFFVACPLNLPGGAGSPANSIAIR